LFRICHYEGSGKPRWLELNGTHQLLVYADDVKMLGGSIHTIKKNTKASVVMSKETDLEVNANKIKYMFMS